MGEENNRDITGITVRYSDGSTKEIQSGCCVDLEKERDDQKARQEGSTRREKEKRCEPWRSPER